MLPSTSLAEAVLALSKELRQAAGVHARAPRSTKVALASLSFDIPGMTRHRTFELFVRELQGQFPEGSKFCETSSSFEVGNIKNESLLRDFLQESKVECRADGLVPMRLAICSFHLSKVLRLPRKSEARSYEVLRLSRKIILANLKIWCSKMQPLSGNQRPDLLTSLTHVSLALSLQGEMHLCRSFSKAPYQPKFLKLLQNLHVLLTFGQGAESLAPATQSDASTSKSGPNVVCFVHFDFEMCLASQWRALFRQLNFQLSTCWHRNVLRVTTSCPFSTAQLPKALRHWGVLYICSTSHLPKCSDVGVFFTFLLRSVLRATVACNFSSLIWPEISAPAALASLLFDPPEPRNIVFTFSRTCIFFLLTLSLLFSSLLFSSLLFSSLTLPTSAFHVSILSEVWLLNLLR